ncbi:UNVERIFIED_CONTAM: hypothetical protein FKN15_033778 [Acipenser sinensis]
MLNYGTLSSRVYAAPLWPWRCSRPEVSKQDLFIPDAVLEHTYPLIIHSWQSHTAGRRSQERQHLLLRLLDGSSSSSGCRDGSSSFFGPRDGSYSFLDCSSSSGSSDRQAATHSYSGL